MICVQVAQPLGGTFLLCGRGTLGRFANSEDRRVAVPCGDGLVRLDAMSNASLEDLKVPEIKKILRGCEVGSDTSRGDFAESRTLPHSSFAPLSLPRGSLAASEYHP